MKKIVGIVSVLALASALFADAPAFAPAVSEYTGEASIGYTIDLDAETMGITSADSASVKFSLWTGGSKATTGDGLWGELAIKSDGSGDNNVTGPAAPAVDVAKIHFVDDDFYAVVDIKNHGLSVGGGALDVATNEGDAPKLMHLPETSVALAGADGFTLNTGLKDVVDANIVFVDNGVVKSDAKKFALKAEASLKAVENLEAYAGMAWSQEEDDIAIAAKAGYKVNIDDGLFVKPSVGFAMKGDAKDLGANVLLCWGAIGAEPGFIKVNNVATVNDKCSEGVSVTVTALNNMKDFAIAAGIYDQSLVAGLKVGAEFATVTTKNAGFSLGVAAKYGTAIDIWNLSCEAGALVVNAADKTNMGFAYKAGVNTDGIIQNTTLSCEYAGEAAEKLGGANLKGTITMSAKIHF